LITKAGVTVDFSRSSGVGNLNVITVGSIEGAGHFRLGDNKLYVGSNNRSTKVSGAIDDGGSNGGSGAVLHKVGTGTLTLSHAGNTYSNGTVLTRGTLDVAAKGAAGPGSIDFDAGRQTLKIENKALANHAFSNVVTSFDTGDAIDLAGLKFVKHARATYDAGSKVLTVHSGKVTDTLTLIPAVLQFKAVDDGHGGTKIIARPPGAKPDALAARAHDSNQLRDGEHRAAGDSFHFKTFAERGEHGSSGRDFHPGAESAASDHSHDALQQTMTGGFHVDFAAGTASLIGQQHFVNPLHGDFIL